jgi:hypothetical protein
MATNSRKASVSIAQAGCSKKKATDKSVSQFWKDIRVVDQFSDCSELQSKSPESDQSSSVSGTLEVCYSGLSNCNVLRSCNLQSE